MVVQKHISSRAWLEILLLGTIWGGVFLAAAIALKEIPPFTLVAIRIVLAAAVLWAYVLLRKSAIPKGWRVWGAIGVMGILNNAIPFTLLTLGQTQIESGLTSIFNAGTAVFGILVAAIFLKDERLTTHKLIGVLLGISGIIYTVGIQSLQTFDLRSLGQLSCIGATVSYAFAGVWARKNLSGLRPDSATAGMLTIAALVTSLSHCLWRAPPPSPTQHKHGARCSTMSPSPRPLHICCISTFWKWPVPPIPC